MHELFHLEFQKMSTKNENVVDDWEAIDDSEVSQIQSLIKISFFVKLIRNGSFIVIPSMDFHR